MNLLHPEVECLMTIVGGLELLDTNFPGSAPLMAQIESGGSVHICLLLRFSMSLKTLMLEDQNRTMVLLAHWKAMMHE